jgi:RNA polymerase sigma factor (sigma-70 family)
MALIAALQRLGSRQRAVVFLRFWSDLSTESTAAVLGCSPGTVRSQTHRALATLRGTLLVDGWS